MWGRGHGRGHDHGHPHGHDHAHPHPHGEAGPADGHAQRHARWHAQRHARREAWRGRHAMRRGIFFGFGAAILATALAVGGIMRLLGAGDGHRPAWHAVLFMLVPAAIMWGISGRVARRLSRPLQELTAVARDLGEGRLERRSALTWARGEVGALSSAMNEMAERLERKIKAERDLLAATSHELRTPLARVRLLCELGRAGTTRDVLAEIEREAVAMDGLVGDLLANARLDLDAVRRAPVDLVGLAREAIARHAARTDTPAVPLDDAEAPRAPLAVDATLIARALDTLLENARVHAGGATHVRVAANEDGTVGLAVEDAGPGFAPDELEAMFEPFRRGTTATGAGVGLGLHLVRRISEAHGGTARAENLAPGARVSVTIRG